MVTFWPVGLSVILLPRSRGFDDGVLYLGVSDGGVVSDARVGVDERVWADDGCVRKISLLSSDRGIPVGVRGGGTYVYLGLIV